MTLIPEQTLATGEFKVRNNNDKVVAMLKGEGTYATTILVWAVDHFGLDDDGKSPIIYQWHPTTLAMEIESATGVTPRPGNFDRLMAAITILTTDLFFKDVDSFIHLANILAGCDASTQSFDIADSVECAWAITEGLLLAPPDASDPEPFCDEIRHYLTHVLKEEGYVTPPDVLRIAIDANFSAQVTYNFADNPALFGAINDVQTSKTDDVNNTILLGLQELLAQVKALPLQHGDARELEKRLGAMLRTKKE